MAMNHIHCPGKKPYIIPRGGSSDRSIWGYIDCWSEMENQDYFNEITDIVVVSGSGGTGLDLALANYWSGFRKRVHGVRIWGESKDFFSHAKHSLDWFPKTLRSGLQCDFRPRSLI